MGLLKIESSLFIERKNQIDEFTARIKENHRLLHDENTAMAGWVRYSETINQAAIEKIMHMAAKVQESSTVLVVIGIGGSYLGSRACCEMLKYVETASGIKVIYAGWNLSSDYHHGILELIKDEDVSLCVISKSGSTMETVMAFDVFKDFLKAKYGKDYCSRIYAITDETEGILRREVDDKNYVSFPIDKNIGGRYSVLTAVGMFPVAVRGFDIQKILAGAKKAYDDFSNEDLSSNYCYQYAVLRNILFSEGKVIEAFSTMEPHMYPFSEWLKQLFGESEGKNGKGIFPTCIRYSTDLHSIGQFMEEGNPILFESMIMPANCNEKLTETYEGKTYSQLNALVSDAVYKVRQQNNTPIFRFTMSELGEEAYGYILYFFEKACAMCCLLQGVDPFDQPGVEVYKKEIIRLIKGNVE